MRHHQYNPDYNFVKAPVDFNKYTDRSLLQYCLGATMYMPGTKDFAQAVIDKKYPGLTSMVMCFEDACPEEDVPAAEINSIHVLDTLKEAEDSGKLKYEDTLMKRKAIVNDAVDGLMRELVLDQANDFMGKTCIHPTHLNFINGMLAVTKDEYDDAYQIMHTKGGVIKGTKGMNEIGPHKNWAEKIMMRAQAYGVIENDASYIELFGV